MAKPGKTGNERPFNIVVAHIMLRIPSLWLEFLKAMIAFLINRKAGPCGK
jgi:hypothetical protein